MNLGRQASVSIVLLELDNGSTAYQVQALSDGPDPSKADELAAQLVQIVGASRAKGMPLEYVLHLVESAVPPALLGGGPGNPHHD